MIKTLKIIFLALVTPLILFATITNAGENKCAEDPGYPTWVRADYVFACMAANGENPEILRKCSCSIDVIASILPYEQYERAETVMTLQQDRGQRGIFFRDTSWAKHVVENLKQAQAESTLRCF